jgi:hypothetical protein
MKKLILLIAIGAGLAYLFDPDSGIRRRANVRRKLQSFGKQTPQPPAGPLSQVA